VKLRRAVHAADVRSGRVVAGRQSAGDADVLRGPDMFVMKKRSCSRAFANGVRMREVDVEARVVHHHRGPGRSLHREVVLAGRLVRGPHVHFHRVLPGCRPSIVHSASPCLGHEEGHTVVASTMGNGLTEGHGGNRLHRAQGSGGLDRGGDAVQDHSLPPGAPFRDHQRHGEELVQHGHAVRNDQRRRNRRPPPTATRAGAGDCSVGVSGAPPTRR